MRRSCVGRVLAAAGGCILVLLLAQVPGMGQQGLPRNVPLGVGGGFQSAFNQMYGPALQPPISGRSFQYNSWESAAFPGLFSAAVDFGTEGGVNLRVADFGYSVPVRLEVLDIGRLFVIGKSFRFSESLETESWATGLWRFGGFFARHVGNGLYVGLSGTFDLTRRSSRWHRGGTGSIQITQFAPGYQRVTLMVRYGIEAAGDVFPRNMTGWESITEYSIGAGWDGPRVGLFAQGYNFDVGEKQEGYFVGASLSAFSGMIRLTGRGGRDSLMGAHYRLGASINLRI